MYSVALLGYAPSPVRWTRRVTGCAPVGQWAACQAFYVEYSAFLAGYALFERQQRSRCSYHRPDGWRCPAAPEPGDTRCYAHRG